jgi:hypothetical protein
VKRTFFLLILALIFLCQPFWRPAAQAAATDKDYLLYYSNNVLGETEPCG